MLNLHSALTIVDAHSKIRLGFVDKKWILVGVGSSVCWRRRLFNLAEKIMPQLIQYRAKNGLVLKKLCRGSFFMYNGQNNKEPLNHNEY